MGESWAVYPALLSPLGSTGHSLFHPRGLYASGDGDAMEGNSVIFFWMESAPILSFSFRVMAPRNALFSSLWK